DLVKCFSFNSAKKRKEDKEKFHIDQCLNKCFPYLLAEINYKRPRLLFFTAFGAYDAFVKKVAELNFGQIKGHTSKRNNISILRREDYSCYLIRGTVGDRLKRSNDYEKHKDDMIETIAIALKSVT
ncbi:MAG: hypothetical protein ACYDEQ_03925, partial [Desulfocucumaceae bacterium]